MKKAYFILLLVGLVCGACQPNAKQSNGPSAIGNEYKMAGFSIEPQGDHIMLAIYSPWQKGNVMQEVMIGNGQWAIGERQKDEKQKAMEVAKRVVCTSATHIGFINELGMIDKVVGVCSPELIYSLDQEERERIANIGNDVQLNLEALMLCKPDVVILSSYGQGDDRAQQIEALGIPVIYCHEWTEHTPLARAEWIRMFGAVLGCMPKADSTYASVCDAYAQLVTMGNGQLAIGRSIMSGMSWRGTWYVPAGGTFMGQLFKDAGAAYRYADNPSTSSIPLQLEQVLQDFAQADVWVGCEANSLKELEAINNKHTWFKAFQTKQVYNFRRRCLPSGANDFWESGVIHPERILQDIQSVIKGDTSALYYITALQ